MTGPLTWKRHLGALLVVGFVVFMTIAGADKMIEKPGSEHIPKTQSGIGDLVASSRVCQTFVSEYNGLAQIEVVLHTMERETRGPFHFYLRTTPDAPEDLVALAHDAAEVENDVYRVFEFPSIRDSGGQSYVFCLEAPMAEQKRSITVIGTLEDRYPDGEATFREMWGGAAGIQDLDFRLVYHLSWWQKLVALSERVTANKPFLCGAPWFYALLGIAYLALLYALFLKFPPSHQDPAP